MIHFKKQFFILLAIIISIVADTQAQPNIIIINIDDLGYGETEPYFSRDNRTPSLSKLAEEGVVLTSFYSACSVCSPSRAALLTGCYPQRIGLGMGASNNVVLFPGDSLGLSTNEITLAEHLKKAGYSTACIGKWHLGDQAEFLPTNHGFDYYYGIPYSNDMWPQLTTFRCPPLPLLKGVEVIDTISTNEKQSLLCEQFTNEAISYIKQNSGHPFFLYLPHSFIHKPWIPQESFKKGTINPIKKKGGTISEVDHSVGRIMTTLKNLGIDDNTLLVFMSDNGGVGQNANQPLKGSKGTYWEGGFRVPCIIRYPGKIQEGIRMDGIISAIDIYPTLAHMAGIDAKSEQVTDGLDMSDYLTGSNKSSPRDLFYYYWKNEMSAIRYKEWKLLYNGQLFNLENDISETKDVSAAHPKIVQTIEEHFQKARHDLGDARLEILGANCRNPGRISQLSFIIPGKDKNGDLKDYWPVVRIR